MPHFRLTYASMIALLAASCGGGSTGSPDTSLTTLLTPAAAVTPMPTPLPAPTPTSTPTPTAAGTMADLIQLDPIASNFDTASELNKVPVPVSNAPDLLGAFRMTCKPSHNSYDDPIVFPNQPGAAHLHTFFGNTLANATSTYRSLRTTGDSTCHSKLNRSAYWMPALINGRGKVVMPDYLTVYYKRWPADSEQCKMAGKGCVPIPRGLRMVFGNTMSEVVPGAKVYFMCQGKDFSGAYVTMAEAAKNCPSGAQIGVHIGAPSCWNGTQLDSLDHRSHLAYEKLDGQGIARCPSTHPWVLPYFILLAWYTTDDTLDRSGSTDANLDTWYFSSDRMPGMPKRIPGSTVHADWFGAWDDGALAAWQGNCIDKLLNCSHGDLGNGTQIKTFAGFSFAANPRLVDIPMH